MRRFSEQIGLSRTGLGIIAAGIIAASLVVANGGTSFPELHTILDTAVVVLSGLITPILWTTSKSNGRFLCRFFSISFGFASLFHALHLLVTVEWSSAVHADEFLRITTWAPGAYLLPIGIIASFSLCRTGLKNIGLHAVGLLVLGVSLVLIFREWPRYMPDGWLGMNRPTMAPISVLWLATAILCWRHYRRDRIVAPLGLMAAIFVLTHLPSPYSRNPQDLPAILSHLGIVAGYLVFLVTLMQMSKDELRESEERFRAMADSAPVLIWVSDVYRDCTWFNRRWLDFVGRTLDEEIGQGWADNIHPDDLERCVNRYQAAYETKEAFAMEYRLRRFDGEWRWLIDQGVPRFQGNHEFTGFIGSCTDITELRQKEDKLRSQLARLDLLHRITRAIGERQDLKSIFQVAVRSIEDNLELDLCCASTYDPEEHVLTVTGIGVRSEALAMDLAITDQARIAIDRNGLSRCVAGDLVYEREISNSKFPFPQRLAKAGLRSFVAAPLLVESKVFGALIAARRVPDGFTSADCEFLGQLSHHVALAANHAQLHTALQQAYDDLRQTQQAVMQQERLRALGQMASGIAHDINNAISPVSLYTESLLETEKGLSDRGRGYLETIQNAIDDVGETVSRMREFYRQREPELTLRQFLVNRLIEQVIELTRARWSDIPLRRGHVIQLKTKLAGDLPPIQGVESEIREALTNLIFNAVDAMPDGGTLTVGTRLAKSGGKLGNPLQRTVEVEISDTGVGMDEETQRRCLEPFYTTKGERGTGLGLAMVYGTLQRHGAELEIESKTGKGTTMRLVFPASSSLTAAPTEPVLAIEPPRRLRLLVVDDDPLLLKSLRDTLETDGHIVTTCDGGAVGIQVFTKSLDGDQRFSVVITDLGMPYVDGRKVASAIKSASADTPVILLTGWGQRLAAEGDVPQNVDLVLSKPPKLRELREALSVVTAR